VDIFPTFASRFGGRETVQGAKEKVDLKDCEIESVSFWILGFGLKEERKKV